MPVKKIDVQKDSEFWKIPPETLASLKRYVEHGVETGGFLRAVLENDLFGAVSRADLENRKALTNIVMFIYNTLPYQCHGNHIRVEEWLSGKWRK